MSYKRFLLLFGSLYLFCSWTALTQDRTLIDKYCVTCHNQKAKTAGLALDTADFARPSNSADVWEKVVRKLRAERMPPVGAPRPEKAASAALASYLEASLDAAAAANPN